MRMTNNIFTEKRVSVLQFFMVYFPTYIVNTYIYYFVGIVGFGLVAADGILVCICYNYRLFTVLYIHYFVCNVYTKYAEDYKWECCV